MANISKHIRTVSFLLQDVRADHKGAGKKKNQKHNPNNKTELKQDGNYLNQLYAFISLLVGKGYVR